jgi:hypothetical protein
MLAEIGEYVKSASSTIEAPTADALRRRCGRWSSRSQPAATPAAGSRCSSDRSYPRNNPYMDLGKTEIDHLQAADRAPRPPQSLGPRPLGLGQQRPEPIAPLPPRRRRPRREWYRDAEPS